jgi:NADH-quinone oxidoreductase subunit N
MPAAALVSIDAVALAPVLLPALGALAVLVGDAVLPGRRTWPPLFGIAVLLVAAGTAAATALRPATDPVRTLCLPAPDGACLWTAGPATGALQAGILLATAAALALLRGTGGGPSDARGGPRDTTVTSALFLTAAAGGVGVAASSDIGTWLVTLELATVPLVALVALRGTRTAAHGAVTLLVTSVTSFALLVLGSALWLTATGDPAFAADTVAEAWADPQRKVVLVLAAAVLFSGLGFKLSLVPFHAWTPQAYSTADLGTAAALATTSKISAAAALLVVVQAVAGAEVDAGRMSLVLGVVAGASMLLGNVLALRQDDATRLLAWSTVAQAGWVVLPVAAFSAAGVRASAAYVLVYAVATLVAFAAVAIVGAGPIERFRGLLRRDRLTGGALALALLVLAGLPPGVIGLVAKVVALGPAVDAGLWPLIAVAVVAVVLGIAVYLRWFALLLGEVGDGGAAGADAERGAVDAVGAGRPVAVAAGVPGVVADGGSGVVGAGGPGAVAAGGSGVVGAGGSGAVAAGAPGARRRRRTAQGGARAVLVLGTVLLVLLSALPALLLDLLS